MRGAEIVIVEDDSLDQELYINYLNESGYHLSFCSSNEAAINLATAMPPDLMIVDLGLPDGSGVTTIAALRTRAKATTMAILVVTGSTDPVKHEAALAAGADKVLTKPIDGSTLRAVIWELTGAGD